MALLQVRTLAPKVRLGLWRIEETEEQLLALLGGSESMAMQEVKNYRSSCRRIEVLAVRALLWAMTGQRDSCILHGSAGQPLLEGQYISISHTEGYAAIILSEEQQVAIDIEWMSDRIRRVATKFLLPDELSDSTIELLRRWCVKETVYKYFPTAQLEYFDMHILPPQDGATERVVEVLPLQRQVRVVTEVTSCYVLSYIFLNS